MCQRRKARQLDNMVDCCSDVQSTHNPGEYHTPPLTGLLQSRTQGGGGGGGSGVGNTVYSLILIHVLVLHVAMQNSS